VAVNVTGLPPRPLAPAASVFCPTSTPSRQLPTLATPVVSVVADAPVTRPPPDAGANETPTPGTGLLNWSRTITAGAVGRIAFTTAVWPSPASCAICVAAPAIPLAVNFTGVTPDSVAVRVSVPAV